MPPYMLELAMSAVAPSTVDLDRAICRFGAQSVGPIIAHADLVTELVLLSLEILDLEQTDAAFVEVIKVDTR